MVRKVKSKTEPRPGGGPRSAESTKARFLDAAERVFALHGYEGTTIRAISEEAKVQLGALHYYWGSKEAMFLAVLERRLRPQTEERLARLEAVLIRSKGKPSIHDVLLAYYEPLLAIAVADKSGAFTQLVLRALTDPSPAVRHALATVTDEAGQRFLRMMRTACTNLDDTSFNTRMPAVMGGMLYAVCNRTLLGRRGSRGENLPDVSAATHECIELMTAMLQTPPLAKLKGKRSASKTSAAD